MISAGRTRGILRTTLAGARAKVSIIEGAEPEGARGEPVIRGLPRCCAWLKAAGMLNTRILNPAVLSLLARIRHTNSLVIADRGFPFWPQLETVDISLMNDVPSVLQVVSAIRPDFQIVQAYMAQEFLDQNTATTRQAFADALAGIPLTHEPHIEFKKRVPSAIGLIRTGETIQYANLIIVSG